MNADLLPHEIGYACVIKALIYGGRRCDVQMSSNVMIPLHILCWLDDSIHLLQTRKFSSLRHMYDDLIKNIPSLLPLHNDDADSMIITTKLDVLEEMFNEFQTQSVDELIELVDTFPLLFEHDADASPNLVPAPTKLCHDSNLGIFVRALLARWECMPFEAVCLLQEKMEKFVKGSSGNLIFEL